MKRPGRRLWGWGAVGLAAAVAIWWLCRPPDVSEWPRYQAFCCRECGGPIAVNPDDPDEWACPHCNLRTRDLVSYFEPSSTASVSACLRAGRYTAAAGTPAAAWSRDRHDKWWWRGLW